MKKHKSYLDTTNNILTGEVVDIDSPTNATINCVFLPEFSGAARCQVQYGTDPTYMSLPYSAESNKNGTAGDFVRVVLREQLNSSTEYYYTVSAVSGDVSVTVQANFTTPQYSKYIINMLLHVNIQCILTCSERDLYTLGTEYRNVTMREV